MKLFGCQNCGQVLFFDNQNCGRCGYRLGFIPSTRVLSALNPSGAEWSAVSGGDGGYRFCDNAKWAVCNWLIPADSPEEFCVACRHNRIVPDLSVMTNLQLWGKMEAPKHRLFYTLLQLGLSTPNRVDRPGTGLVFDFLMDEVAPGSGKVMTGHDDGLITMAVAEADDAERETRRARMGEPYRTLLGHFRHEVGHFFWDMLIRDEGRQDSFRQVFGDETDDYQEALRRYYQNGPPPDWQNSYVSAYAASHPWEDWAETWAHYLHIVDGLETAEAFRLEAHPLMDPHRVLDTGPSVDAFGDEPFERLVHNWLSLTIALNAMNQSMGLNDLYPFVLSGTVIKKLSYIHAIVHRSAMA